MEHGATTSLEERRWFAKEAFAVSSHYDSAIFNYFDGEEGSAFRQSANNQKTLRYGENPHQKGYFYGNIDAMFDQIHGKEISYNNLLDINAAVDLIDEFTDTTFAMLSITMPVVWLHVPQYWKLGQTRLPAIRYPHSAVCSSQMP